MVSSISLIFPILMSMVIVSSIVVACFTWKCCYIKKRMCAARRRADREAHEGSHPISSSSQPEISTSIPSHSPQTSPWPLQPHAPPQIPYVPGQPPPIGFTVNPSMLSPGTHARSVQEYPIGPAPFLRSN